MAMRDGSMQSELSLMLAESDEAGVVVTEGVIDLAVASPDGWRIVDWKSDDVSDDVWMSRRHEKYDWQLARYAAMLTAVTTRTTDATLVRVGRELISAQVAPHLTD